MSIPRAVRYAVAWVLAAGLAVGVGLLAVSSAGDGVRGRGPLGNEVLRDVDLERTPSADPSAAVVSRTVEDEFGSFVVECRGSVAYGVEVRPDTASGWTVVSYERGPDDDVDAVFSRDRTSVELEVFCNRGQPTVSDREEHVLPADG
ncbi:hypothetical protein [Nocardioides sp. W7]|uniref:hypothetical protein n=1 Tax=Nocardioides sp. W7 TaxID=2931390 RepID=UPI001FD1CA91|nr:hypothetical protein [Nocardioides sp. W7]